VINLRTMNPMKFRIAVLSFREDGDLLVTISARSRHRMDCSLQLAIRDTHTKIRATIILTWLYQVNRQNCRHARFEFAGRSHLPSLSRRTGVLGFPTLLSITDPR